MQSAISSLVKLTLSLSVFCLSIFLVGSASAEESSDLSLTLSTGLFTDYMFRGQNLYDGTSIQPDLDVAYSLGEMGSLGANVSAYLSGEGGQTDTEKFTEVDYLARWDYSLGDFDLSLGHYWYEYPRDSDDIESTREFYASIAHNCELNPYISVTHDYDLYDYDYLEFGVSHTIEGLLGEGFQTTPYAAIGYATNADKIYADNSGITHVVVGTSFDFKTGDLSVTPTLNYNFKVDDSTQNEFFTGIYFSYGLM